MGHSGAEMPDYFLKAIKSIPTFTTPKKYSEISEAIKRHPNESRHRADFSEGFPNAELVASDARLCCKIRINTNSPRPGMLNLMLSGMGDYK